MNKFLKICLMGLALVPLVADSTIFTPENSVFFMRTIMMIVSIIFLIGFIYVKDFRVLISEKLKYSIIGNPVY